MTHLNSNLHVSTSFVFYSEVLVLISCYLHALFTCSGPHKSNLCSFFCCSVPLFQPFWLSYSASGQPPFSISCLLQSSQPSSSNWSPGFFFFLPFPLSSFFHSYFPLSSPGSAASPLPWLSFCPDMVFFSLKEFLWPQWFLCYKSIHSSLPFLPLRAKQLKYFPDLIKSSHTFDCSRPWLTQLFSSLPYNSLLRHRSICACS